MSNIEYTLLPWANGNQMGDSYTWQNFIISFNNPKSISVLLKNGIQPGWNDFIFVINFGDQIFKIV